MGETAQDKPLFGRPSLLLLVVAGVAMALVDLAEFIEHTGWRSVLDLSGILLGLGMVGFGVLEWRKVRAARKQIEAGVAYGKHERQTSSAGTPTQRWER